MNKSLYGHRNILPLQDASSTLYAPWHGLVRKDEKYFTSVLCFGRSVFPKHETQYQLDDKGTEIEWKRKGMGGLEKSLKSKKKGTKAVLKLPVWCTIENVSDTCLCN